jgi:XTP/dITP diphosphohydrolase
MSRRRLTGQRLVVASHNPGKVREIAELVSARGIETVSAAELDLPEPEETGSTFIANAELKALAAATSSGMPAVADDSGLAVHALGGEPGIYSARWAGPGKDFTAAMRLVEDRLGAGGSDDRTAHFACALCLAWPDGHTETFEGTVYGTLVWPPRGDKGFGYDPVFLADGEAETFGEMGQSRKHAMSHRANAFALLVEACLDERS